MKQIDMTRDISDYLKLFRLERNAALNITIIYAPCTSRQEAHLIVTEYEGVVMYKNVGHLKPNPRETIDQYVYLYDDTYDWVFPAIVDALHQFESSTNRQVTIFRIVERLHEI